MTENYTYFEGDCKCFRPVLFALNNEVDSCDKLIEFLVSYGLKYEGKQNFDNYGYSRENVFSYGDFKLVISWMRNLAKIKISPNGWDGAFMECSFDHIRECSTGYCDHESLSFCLGHYEKMKLAVPLKEGETC
jgi:hypothetical protein